MDRVLAGRYELEVPLGRGGSGEVWRGRDLVTRRPVAVKLVELSLIDDGGLMAETIGRFRREANVIAELRHPNIVGSLDAGRVGNRLFMVMELAPGVSLTSMMEQRAARLMQPGGAMVVWSASPAPALETAMAEAFDEVSAHPQQVRLLDRDERYWLYLATVR